MKLHIQTCMIKKSKLSLICVSVSGVFDVFSKLYRKSEQEFL